MVWMWSNVVFIVAFRSAKVRSSSQGYESPTAGSPHFRGAKGDNRLTPKTVFLPKADGVGSGRLESCSLDQHLTNERSLRSSPPESPDQRRLRPRGDRS